MTYTFVQPETRAWPRLGLRNVVLVVSLAIIFAPLGLIALAAA